MHFPDLGNECQIADGDHVRAVGWLSSEAPFAQGAVPELFLKRLRVFADLWEESTIALEWPVAAGVHTCELCGGASAGGNFGVPSAGLLFIAPELIVHYVIAHEYAPPAEFLRALMDASLPGTPEYRTAAARFVAR